MAKVLGEEPLAQRPESAQRGSLTERIDAPELNIPEPFVQRCMKDPTAKVIFAVFCGLVIGAFVFEFKNLQIGGINIVKDATLLLSTPGKLWLKALKCIVLPMIIFAMIDAMIMMKSLPGAKYVASAVITWYTIFPLCAGAQACTYATLIILNGNTNVNHQLTEPPPQLYAARSLLETVQDETMAPTQPPAPSLLETLLGIATNMVPKNLVMEAYGDNLLPVIVASLTFGILMRSKEDDGSPTKIMLVCQDMNAVVFRVIAGLMSVTPFAISSLVFGAVASKGLESLAAASVLCIAVVVALFSHFFIFYPTMIAIFARRNPVRYMLNCAPTFIQAIGTSSSAACLPVSLKVAIENNKIAPHIANFVINLGATIGMDGTAIYLITAVIFIGNLQGNTFSTGNYITLALMAALSAAGSAPIPNASLFLIQVISSAVGVQIDSTSLGLITAVDWALDRLRTTVNVAGDQTVSALLHAKFASEQHTEQQDAHDITDEKVGTFVKESKSYQARKSGTFHVV